jgi:hypothetical protein
VTVEPKELVPVFFWRIAVRDSELPRALKLVALVLSTYMDAGGDGAFPSAKVLARDTGYCQRVVKDARAALADLGWLLLTSRAGTTTVCDATIGGWAVRAWLYERGPSTLAEALEMWRAEVRVGEGVQPLHPSGPEGVQPLHPSDFDEAGASLSSAPLGDPDPINALHPPGTATARPPASECTPGVHCVTPEVVLEVDPDVVPEGAAPGGAMRTRWRAHVRHYCRSCSGLEMLDGDQLCEECWSKERAA